MKSVVKYLIAFSLLICVNVIGQTKTIPNSFIIKNNKEQAKEDFYKRSIEEANMESYRLKEKRVTLIFDNGFEVELLSAKEVFMKNATTDPTVYPLEFPQRFLLPTFKVLPEGQLTATYTKVFKD